MIHSQKRTIEGLMAMGSSSTSFSSLKAKLSSDELALLSKYRARRKYVIGLQPSLNDGLSESVCEAYFVMLKLSLAFTATEKLTTLTGQKGNLGIFNPTFVKALNAGRFDKLLVAMDKDNLRRFEKNDNPEIHRWKNLPETRELTKFVYQCRNFMFHGSFTPTETGFRSATLRHLILELADSTLAAGEIALDKWVAKKLNKQKK
jgi:hypothetical protein